MRRLQVFLLMRMLPLLAPTVAVAQEVPAYRWLREVDLPEISKTTLVAAPLDSHFFEFTRESWPDVRLRNEQGEAIASIIRAVKVGKPRSVRQFWPAEQLSAKVTEAVGLQVEFDLRPKEPIPSGIRIVTPLRDFEHQVQVESSADGQTWKSAGPSTVIFDYTRHVDARSDLVSLNADNHRRFRITIADLTAEQDSQLMELQRRLRGGEEVDRTERSTIARRPFRIDRIEFYRDDAQPESREVQTTVCPANKFATSEKIKEHQTILEFTTQREPITGMKIITVAENFSRAATVEAERPDANEKMEWRPVATGTITRFAVGTIHREELKISLPEHRSERYRIIIENRDSPPLPITDVELSGPIYELAFLASPGQQVMLEYGSGEAKAGHYDTAALQAVLAQGQLPAPASLRPPRETSNVPRGPSWKPWNDTRVLVGSIIVLTLMLGWGLFRASQRLDGVPPAEGTP
jgi:hypothetical protein